MAQPKIKGILTGLARFLFGSDGTQWVAWLVDEDGHGHVDVETLPGINEYDNIPFGYNDRYSEDLGGTQSGAGAYSQAGTEVPTGEVWVLQHLSLTNETGARTRAWLEVYDGAAYNPIASKKAPDEDEMVSWNGALVMKEGDVVRVRMTGCQDGDIITALARGYKVKVA